MDEEKTSPSEKETNVSPAPVTPSSNTTPTTTGSQLIAPGEWISQSWMVYKKLWKRLLLLIFLNYVAMIPLGIIASLFILIGAMNPKGFFSPGLIIGIFVAVIVAFMYISVTSSLLSIAIILAIKERAESAGIKALLKEAWGKLWAYWYVSFLVGFLVMGGMLLFIIPGIIFSVWFSFSMYVFLFEGKKGMDALITSREYVRGRWLGVLGRGLLIGLLVLVVTYVPSILLSLLKLKSVGGIFQTVISFAAAPFPTIASVLLFESARKGRDVSKLATGKEKMTYTAVAILGLVVFIGLFAFIAFMAFSTLTSLPKNKPYAPNQYTKPYTIPTFAPPASST